MTVLVRNVKLGEKRENVLDILNRNLQDILHAFRFDWLYRNIRVDQPGRGFDCRKETGKVVGVASVFPPALWVGDRMLRGRRRKHSLSGLDISFQPGPFGKEFSRLDERIAGNGGGIRAQRRRKNWSYRQDPLHHEV